MFAFSFRGNSKAVMEADRVCLRHPEMNDYMQWSALRASSASFLQPWEPRWPRDDLSRISFRNRLRRYGHEISSGTGYPFFLVRQEDGALLGGITLGHVRRGVSQSAQIGYWIGEAYSGQGFMSEGLNLMCEYAFSRHGLHRLEAACIPTNERSIKLLEKTGFEREGLLKSYLKIDEKWQDHVLFARLNPLHEKPSDGTTTAYGIV